MVELLRIVMTDCDVSGLADEFGVDRTWRWTAPKRWCNAIGEAACALVNEQPASDVQHGNPESPTWRQP
jgi:hypothetical protein